MGETVHVQLSHHASLGNDFLIAFTDAVPADAADLAVRLCDRATGIGADGLVFGTPVDEVGGDGDRLRFTLVNSDGSPAEVSGNGLNCFGQAVASRRGLTNAGLTVETVAGPREIAVAGAPGDTEVRATVDMGAAAPGPATLGLELDLGGPAAGRHGTVDLGNPHLVIEVDDVDAIDLGVVGPALEAFFAPVGCNVHVVAAVDGGTIRMRPWERGAGLTQACGSGACAAAHLARGWGLVGDRVEVRMPGGTGVVTVGERLSLATTSVHLGDHEVEATRG